MNTNTQELREALETIVANGKPQSCWPGHFNGAEHLRCMSCGYRWAKNIEPEQHSKTCPAQIAKDALSNPPAPEQPSGEQCPNCPNQGWYVVNNGGEPEQQQCEFCETVPNSIFNTRRDATTTAEPAVEAVTNDLTDDLAILTEVHAGLPREQAGALFRVMQTAMLSASPAAPAAAQVAQPLTETQVIGLMNDHLHYNGALSVAWDMPVYACTVENVRNLLAAAHGIGKDQAS